jgi:hypothetical protein
LLGIESFSVTAQDEFGNPVLYLDQPYRMSVQVSEEVLARHAGQIRPGSLHLVVWDEDMEAYVRLSESEETNGDGVTVVGMLDHFSDFAVVAELLDDPEAQEPGESMPPSLYLPFAQR